MRYLLTLLLILTSLTATSKELVVGITPIEPFVMQDAAGKWYGIDVALWEKIAEQSEYEYRYVKLPLETNLASILTEDVDIALGAISITQKRESFLDFSHAYYTSGLGIITKRQTSSSFFDMLTNLKFIKSVGYLLGFIIVGGLLILFFESGAKNPDFKKSDVSNGVWWSIVTITTTGYGDLVPKTVLGRSFGGLWMIIGAIIAPMLIGSMSANLTIDQRQSMITDRNDLRNHAIGVIADTSSEDYFIANHIPYTSVQNVEHMISLIKTDQLDGGVYDAPSLQYYARQDPKLMVLSDVFERQNYGFALKTGSELREPINSLLLKEINTRTWLQTLKQYLGE